MSFFSKGTGQKDEDIEFLLRRAGQLKIAHHG